VLPIHLRRPGARRFVSFLGVGLTGNILVLAGARLS
jgi:hypothetical protein